MATSITCPECDADLRVRNATPGKKLRCPKCQKVFPVPAPKPGKKADVVEVVEEVADEPKLIPCPKCATKLRVRDAAPGKKLRCSKCQKVFEIPADEEEAAMVEEVVEEVEPVDDEDEDERDDRRRRGGNNRDRRRRDEDEDEEDDRPRQSEWEPCPKCDSERIKKVKWTVWGSFYGPALLSHVRCQDCGYAYNGRSGRSNVVPAILFISVPLAVIAGLLVWVFFIFRGRGWI